MTPKMIAVLIILSLLALTSLTLSIISLVKSNDKKEISNPAPTPTFSPPF